MKTKQSCLLEYQINSIKEPKVELLKVELLKVEFCKTYIDFILFIIFEFILLFSDSK